MNVQHIEAGVARGFRLVVDDRDRLTLIRDIHDAFGPRLLAYCIMDTHYHLLAECSETEARALAAQFSRRYTRAFNKRHGFTRRRLIEAPLDVRDKATAEDIGRSIRYDHQNPIKARITDTVVAYEWSSARAFAGLARTPYPNIERARFLVGEHARWALPAPHRLANLERVSTPRVPPGVLLAAAARTFGLLVDELVSDVRRPSLTAPRATFVVLGKLEGFADRQLAPWLHRSRVRIATLAADDVDLEAVRTARTLVETGFLRARLPQVAVPAGADDAATATVSAR